MGTGRSSSSSGIKSTASSPFLSLILLNHLLQLQQSNSSSSPLNYHNNSTLTSKPPPPPPHPTSTNMAKFALLVIAAIATLSAGAMGFSDNCNGSGRCNKNMKSTCQAAFARFTDGTTYNSYTSRVSGSCTAIYRCTGTFPALTGAQLKQQFNVIYTKGCQGCGSHAFNGGSCEVTVNFCSNCLDSGNPN